MSCDNLHRRTRRAGILIIGMCAVLVPVACGDDDDGAVNTAGDTRAVAEATAGSETTIAVADDTEGDAVGTGDTGPEDYCALAADINEQDDFPSEEQLERYKELAPEAIREDAEVVADAFIQHQDDIGAIFTDADVTERLERIEQYEAEACGIEREEFENPDGVTTEIDDDAQRVDVSALEYNFEFDTPVPSGHVSFVMSNDGEEPHFMFIVKLADGVTLDEALESDDPESLTELEAESDTVDPGGEAYLTFEELEPGEYGMLCFIPTPEGMPHASEGMAVPFTVE